MFKTAPQVSLPVLSPVTRNPFKLITGLLLMIGILISRLLAAVSTSELTTDPWPPAVPSFASLSHSVAFSYLEARVLSACELLLQTGRKKGSCPGQL